MRGFTWAESELKLRTALISAGYYHNRGLPELPHLQTARDSFTTNLVFTAPLDSREATKTDNIRSQQLENA